MASKKTISDDIKDVAKELEELATNPMKVSESEDKPKAAKKSSGTTAKKAASLAKETASKAGEIAKEAAEKASVVAKEAAEKAKPIAKEATSKAKAATEKAMDKAEKASEIARDVAEKAQATAKKAAAKINQAANAMRDVSRTAIVEYAGNQYNVDEVIARCEAKFRAENKKSEYKDIKVYIKPENNAAYYVVDEKSADKIDLI